MSSVIHVWQRSVRAWLCSRCVRYETLSTGNLVHYSFNNRISELSTTSTRWLPAALHCPLNKSSAVPSSGPVPSEAATSSSQPTPLTATGYDTRHLWTLVRNNVSSCDAQPPALIHVCNRWSHSRRGIQHVASSAEQDIVPLPLMAASGGDDDEPLPAISSSQRDGKSSVQQDISPLPLMAPGGGDNDGPLPAISSPQRDGKSPVCGHAGPRMHQDDNNEQHQTRRSGGGRATQVPSFRDGPSYAAPSRRTAPEENGTVAADTVVSTTVANRDGDGDGGTDGGTDPPASENSPPEFGPHLGKPYLYHVVHGTASTNRSNCQTATAAAAEHVPTMRDSEVAWTVWFVGLLCEQGLLHRSDEAVQKLLHAVDAAVQRDFAQLDGSRDLSKWNSSDMGRVVAGLGDIGAQIQCLPSMVRRLEQQLDLVEAAGIAALLCALGKLRALGILPVTLPLDPFLECAQRFVFSMRGRDFVRMVSGLALLEARISSGFARDVVSVVKRKVFRIHPVAFADVVWGIAQLDVKIPPDVVALVLHATLKKLDSCPPQSLSKLVWGTAKLVGFSCDSDGQFMRALRRFDRSTRPDFVAHVFAQMLMVCRDSLLTFKPEHFVMLMSSLAEMHYPVPNDFMADFLIAALQKLSLFGPADFGRLMRAFTSLGYDAPAWFMGDLLSAARERLHDASPEAFVEMVQMLVVMDRRAAADFVAELHSVSSSRWSDLTVDGSRRLRDCLSRIDGDEARLFLTDLNAFLQRRNS